MARESEKKIKLHNFSFFLFEAFCTFSLLFTSSLFSFCASSFSFLDEPAVFSSIFFQMKKLLLLYSIFHFSFLSFFPFLLALILCCLFSVSRCACNTIYVYYIPVTRLIYVGKSQFSLHSLLLNGILLVSFLCLRVIVCRVRFLFRSPKMSANQREKKYEFKNESFLINTDRAAHIRARYTTNIECTTFLHV